MDTFKNLLYEKRFALILAIFVTIKYFVFYSLMGVNSYFSMVVVFSVVLTGILLSVFRNRYLGIAVYFLLSGLMFADATYYGYFGKYLSVNMLGAAGMVGTITECIEEVMRPVNFMCFFDVAVILAATIGVNIIKRKRIADGTELPDELELEIKRVSAAHRKEFWQKIKSFGAVLSETFDRVITYDSERVKGISKREDKPVANKSEAEVAYRDGIRQCWARFATFVVVVLIILLSANVSTFCKSVRNQEFFSYHIYDICDVMSSTSKSNTDSLEYFEDTYPMGKEGPLFGVAEGRNVIYIQLESFMNFVIGREYNGQELTPNLNALIKQDDTVYFDHFYQQIGSGNTSDSEFAANNSIYGTVLSYTYEVYGHTNYFRGLPVLLKEKGYDTAVFHAYEDVNYWSRSTAYPNLGFNRYFGGLDDERHGDYHMVNWMGWGLADSDFFAQSVDLLQDNMKEPYYAFVNTLSNHHPFKMLDKFCFIDVEKEFKDKLVGNYLQSVAYVDYSLGLLFDELKERDMYDDTIFILYGDHAGITHNEENDELMSKLLGTDYYPDSVLLNVPCIIHVPGEDLGYDEPVSKAVGTLDIVPTMAYLLGFDQLDTIYFGHNMFAEGEGFVPEQTFVKRGSFIKGDIMYEIALDGIFEHGSAWNVDTLEPVPIDSLKDDYENGMNLINACEDLLRTDALRAIYTDDSNSSEEETAREYPDRIVVAGYPNIDYVGKGTIDALNASYYAGYRNIMLTLEWGKNAEDLYSINLETGKKAINADDIIEWFSQHDDVHFVFELNGERKDSLDSIRLFFAKQSDEGRKLGKGIIPYANSTGDVTGRYEVLLDVSRCEGKAESIKSFIYSNNIWAVVIDAADVHSELECLTDLGIPVYVSYETGLIEFRR